MSAVNTFTSSDDYYSFGNDINNAQDWIQSFEEHFGGFMGVLKKIINTVPKEGENIDGIKILKHRQRMINVRDFHNDIELVKNGVVVQFSYNNTDGLFVGEFSIRIFAIDLANRIGTTDNHIHRFANMIIHARSFEKYVAELLELRDMFASTRKQ